MWSSDPHSIYSTRSQIVSRDDAKSPPLRALQKLGSQQINNADEVPSIAESPCAIIAVQRRRWCDCPWTSIEARDATRGPSVVRRPCLIQHPGCREGRRTFEAGILVRPDASPIPVEACVSGPGRCTTAPRLRWHEEETPATQKAIPA
jgi:hypothetical protein